jgi:uncharacterized protein YeaO (DUF488 family)
VIKIKRVYENSSKDDGERILVDRLWPRGVSKEKAKIDLWVKEIAPSDELRKWFSHDPLKWVEFKKRYESELKRMRVEVQKLASISKKENLTLLYAAKDEEHNNAVVLKEFVEKLV